MFKSWAKQREAAPANEGRPSASAVDVEYSQYRSRISRMVVRGALIGVIATVTFRVLSAWSSIPTQPAATGSGSTPEILLPSIPASMTLGGFTLLAGVAVALQLAVRTPSEVETQAATVLARRRFLCFLAGMVVLASMTLASYATLPVVASGPYSFDIVRLFAPGIIGTLVALIAADAGVASDPDFAPAELGRVWRARVARRALVGMRLVGERVVGVTGRRVWLQAVLLITVPVLVAFASCLSAPRLTWGARVALVVIALVVALISYALVLRVFLDVVAQDWVGVATVVAMTAAFTVILWLTVVAGMLQRTASDGTRSLTPVLTTAGWAILYAVAPLVLAAWLLLPSRAGVPRLLGWVARGALARKLVKRHRGLEVREDRPVNRLALVAPWLIILPPSALVLGLIAKRQIHLSRESPSRNAQRGDWAANVAIIGTIVLLAALLGAAFGLAAIDPPEWDEAVWG